MKIVKHYWFIAIALITMISFSSCENDEERGFDISGLYGKTWWGEMGFEDPYGERLYSYITFTSGAFPDHGVGTEERCYYDDELYRVYKFDWEIHISRKTKCSTFAKHFVPKSHLLTQFKM